MKLKFLTHCISGKQGEVVDFSARPTQARDLIDKGFAEEFEPKAKAKKPAAKKPKAATRKKKVKKPTENK